MLFLVFPASILAGIYSELLPAKPISGQIQKINAETINSVLSGIVFPDIQSSLPHSQADNITNTENIISGEINNTDLNLPYLQILWLSVAIVMFSGGICKMHRFKKQILNSSSNNVDRETLDLFLQCRKQLKVRGTLRTSEYIKTPLAFGLINPLVILPETGMSADEKRLAFIHELTHIKNGDLWIKFLASAISAVHWFNPLAHLLRRKISMISEEYCDECVIKNMGKEERLLYGNLILRIVSDTAVPQSCSTLSASTRNVKNIKRRLFNMMNFKKSRKSIIALSVIVAFVMCSFAAVYAFAASYENNTAIIEHIHDDCWNAEIDKNEHIDCCGGKAILSDEERERALSFLAEQRGVPVETLSRINIELLGYTTVFEYPLPLSDEERERVLNSFAEHHDVPVETLSRINIELLGNTIIFTCAALSLSEEQFAALFTNALTSDCCSNPNIHHFRMSEWRPISSSSCGLFEWLQRFCGSCGRWLDSVDERQTDTASHSFNWPNPVCLRCGYVAPLSPQINN